MANSMDPREFLEAYGKSIYEVKLTVALAFYLKGATLSEAFEKAKEFTDYLRQGGLP